jgi:hypothetical protein
MGTMGMEGIRDKGCAHDLFGVVEGTGNLV